MPYASEPEVLSLLDVCVGRLLRRPGEDSSVDKERLHHIADWLRAALVNDEPWLKNVDERGQPKKLMKFGSFDAILREADKAMMKAAQKLRSVKLVDSDETMHAEIGGGFYLVRLITPAALDRESAHMQHCIGNGGYDERLKHENHLYLSLRDQQGKAHVTIEIRNGSIVQLQGKQNSAPIRKYCDVLSPYIRASGLGVDVPASHLGHVIDVDGTWHPLDNLPEGLTVKGNLNLSGTKIAALPEDLSVGGSLHLYGTPIAALPKGLSVGRNLWLGESTITALPAGLTVNGDLNIRWTPIKELPKGLVVGGVLRLSNSLIAELPEDLSVGKSIYLDYTPIAALPKGLSVGGDLDLRKTKISALPEGLSVGGDLYLSGMQMNELPKGLAVEGDLYLSNSSIAELPEDLSVGGSLHLYGTPITVLPKGLKVGEGLNLDGTDITAFPDDLTVGGSIHMRRMNVSEVPPLPDSIEDETLIYCENRTVTAKEFRAMMMPKRTSISEKMNRPWTRTST